MKNNKLLIKILSTAIFVLLILGDSNFVLSQTNKDTVIKTFVNKVVRNKVIFDLIVDKVSFCDTENIKFTLKITNRSSNRIAVFKDLRIGSFGGDTITGIYFDFGGFFSPGINYILTMKIVDPSSTFQLNTYLDKNWLLNRSRLKQLNSTISIGYIDSLDKINSYYDWSSLETRFLPNNFIELSSNRAYHAMSFLEQTSFNYKIMDCK